MLSPIHETVRVPLPEPPGGELAGDLSYAQTAREWAVVWVHGFGSRRSGVKSQAVEAAGSRRGWTFAAFDFRGHGQSSGQIRDLCASSLLADLDAVRAFLAGRGIQRLGLIGSSMGAFAAAWYALRAGREVVPACVLLAPAFRFAQSRWDALDPEERERWRTSGVLTVRSEWVQADIGYALAEERTQFRAEDLSARWDRPLLIFHGMQDEVVPYSTSVAFAETAGSADVELRLFKNGDHRLGGFAEEIAEEACRFLSRYF